MDRTNASNANRNGKEKRTKLASKEQRENCYDKERVREVTVGDDDEKSKRILGIEL